MTSAAQQSPNNRHRTERRVNSLRTLHWPERRTGFDRRVPDRTMQALRDSRWLLLGIIAIIGILSSLDLTMTIREMSLGVQEGNPIMRAALGNSVGAAVGIKVGSFVLVSLAIWYLRRYRRILQLAVGAAVLYAALTIYHVIGFLSLI